jgi:RND family efflux transporter MFP subunit
MHFHFIIGALAIFMAGCSAHIAATPPAPPEVIVAKPITTPIVEWDEYVGRIQAIDFVEVRARVSGYLDSVHYDEGQLVQKGDLLAVIDQRPYKAEVDLATASLAEAGNQVQQAEANEQQISAEVEVARSRLDLAKKQLDRVESLVSKHAVTKDEFDVRESEWKQTKASYEASVAKHVFTQASLASAKSAREVAKVRLEIAQLDLQYTEIIAPVTGRIGSQNVTAGNFINIGAGQSTLITTIVSLDPIRVFFDADEAAFLNYQQLEKSDSANPQKLPVYLGLSSEKGDFKHHGHVDFFENVIDSETGTMRVRGIVPNPDLLLTPGLFARVRIPGSKRHDAVLIPDSAISSDQAKKFVLTVNEQGLIERKDIEVGPSVRNLRVVRTGLSGAEQIVVRGLHRVRPGALVTTKEELLAMEDGGLPNEYQPVLKDQWLSQPKSERGYASNFHLVQRASTYRTSTSHEGVNP